MLRIEMDHKPQQVTSLIWQQHYDDKIFPRSAAAKKLPHLSTTLNDKEEV